jgi:hypothetical protein
MMAGGTHFRLSQSGTRSSIAPAYWRYWRRNVQHSLFGAMLLMIPRPDTSEGGFPRCRMGVSRGATLHRLLRG